MDPELAISDDKMKPQPPLDLRTEDLFRHRLENLIDTRHELVKLAELIDWGTLMRSGEKRFAKWDALRS